MAQLICKCTRNGKKQGMDGWAIGCSQIFLFLDLVFFVLLFTPIFFCSVFFFHYQLTNGPAPTNRADHCMAISKFSFPFPVPLFRYQRASHACIKKIPLTQFNVLHCRCTPTDDDGTKLIVYGGRLESNTFSSGFYILTIATGTWNIGASSPLPRIYSACTIAGDQLIVWGGLTSLTQMASGEVMIYDMKSNSWVKQYTPTASYVNQTAPPIPGAVGAKPSTNATVSGVSPPDSTGTSPGTGAGEGAGGIIGGVVGSLALNSLIIAFLVYRRRQRQREQYSTLPVKADTDTGKAKSIPLKHIGNAGSKGDDADYQEPQTFFPARPGTKSVTASTTALYNRNTQGAVYGSAGGGYQGPQSPRGPQTAGEIQLQLRELENQQKQIELKRQLLILEEQEQAL